MSAEIFINYWIGEEPYPPCPTLDQMPAYVNVVPVAFVGVDDNDNLDFAFLTQQFSASDIKGWIRTVRGNGTKVLLSIIGARLGTISPDNTNFISQVVTAVNEWGVDGIDFDFEPPYSSATLAPLIQAIRNALPQGSLFTAPVYGDWDIMDDRLKELSAVVDYITTMDYTPYQGYERTISSCEHYASVIKGGWSQLVIGVSCMGPSDSSNFTPLEDVKKLSAYKPAGGSKGGCMLYTFNYDVTTRPIKNGHSGTGYPDGTWTKTIHEHLP